LSTSTRRFRRRLRVIVIDDDASLRDVLVAALNRYGFRAESVADPAQAEAAVALHGAQIVLCDIEMPGVDGLEVTRRLKARDPGTQVILMTGYPDQASVDTAFGLGVDDYLIKPFPSVQTVLDAVNQAASKLYRWHKDVRASIQEEFPEEYEVIYGEGRALPSAEELEVLLAQATAEDDPVR